jgi:hypothetical protein
LTLVLNAEQQAVAFFEPVEFDLGHNDADNAQQ